MLTKAKNPKAPAEFRGPATMTQSDKVALASAGLAILSTAGVLRQHSNACDMLDMVAGKPCWRGNYILAQAYHIVDALTGWDVSGRTLRDIENEVWDKSQDALAELFAAAEAKRQELIKTEWHSEDKNPAEAA